VKPVKLKLPMACGVLMLGIPEKVNLMVSAEKLLAIRKLLEKRDPSPSPSCRLYIFPFPLLAIRRLLQEKYRLVGF